MPAPGNSAPERSSVDVVLLIVALVVLLGGGVYVLKLNREIYTLQTQIRIRERERMTVFNFLNEIGRRITKRLDLDETLGMLLEFCVNTTKADAGAIFLKDQKEPAILQARVVQGLFPPLHEIGTDKILSRQKYLAEYVKKERLKVGEGIIGLVAATGEPILIRDAASDPRVPDSANELVALRDLILAPLAIKGRVLGVLVLINKHDEDRPSLTFSEEDRDLVTALADQASLTVDIVRLSEEIAEKQRLEQELSIAHDFQAALLPREDPDLPMIEVHGFSKPALEVGGDYYDFIEIDDDHLGVIVGDVSGKGIPGALVMATVRSTLRANALGNHSPSEVLKRVNTHVTRDTKESVFISATYGVLNHRTGIFRFARAGHEPLICCGKNGGGGMALFEPNGMVLGMIEGEVFNIIEEEEIDLKNFGSVVLYTDGVPEAMNQSAEEYGLDRFGRVLTEHGSDNPTELIDSILHDIGEFTAGIPQNDDITLVVMRWGRHSEHLRGNSEAGTG